MNKPNKVIFAITALYHTKPIDQHIICSLKAVNAPPPLNFAWKGQEFFFKNSDSSLFYIKYLLSVTYLPSVMITYKQEHSKY